MLAMLAMPGPTLVSSLVQVGHDRLQTQQWMTKSADGCRVQDPALKHFPPGNFICGRGTLMHWNRRPVGNVVPFCQLIVFYSAD
jgi:hypothetical protein